MFTSSFECDGEIKLPEFSGIRVLMMPFYLEDIKGSLPELLKPWINVIKAMRVGISGMAFITIDELDVPRGKRHRRPGLHVDGWTYDGECGMWGGGGGGQWGNGGWVTVASRNGCAAYRQEFRGVPAEYGNCDHLRDQLQKRETLKPRHMYRMQPMTVHETIPSPGGPRQFARLSLPSELGCWPISCTPNPFGIAPRRIGPARPIAFTNYTPR